MRFKPLFVWALGFGLLTLTVFGSLYLSEHKSPARSSNLISEASAQEILQHIRTLNSPVVLVNFWASWCEPCKKEFPELLSLREKLAAKGVQIIFVSIDEPKDFQAAEEFLQAQHVTFQTFYKGEHSLDLVSEIYPKWEGSVPTTVIFGPELKLLDAWEGDATLAEIEERITRQLKGS